VSSEEPSDAQPHLHRIDSRIRRRQPRVRDVHVAQFEAHIVLRAENMHAQRRLIHEVDRVGPGGNIVVCDQHPADEFQIGGNASVPLKIPLQSQRIEADAVSGVCRLEGEKYGNTVDRVLKTTTQKSGKMRFGENPPVTQTGVEDAGIAATAAHGVSTACPDLDLMSTLLRSSLCGDISRCGEEQESNEKAHKETP